MIQLKGIHMHRMATQETEWLFLQTSNQSAIGANTLETFYYVGMDVVW